MLTEIDSKKLSVYNEPNDSKKQTLKKGDIIIILEQSNDWIKINYGDEKDGWIKRREIK